MRIQDTDCANFMEQEMFSIMTFLQKVVLHFDLKVGLVDYMKVCMTSVQ